MSSSPNEPRRLWIASAALVLLVAVVYAPVRQHSFVAIDTAQYLTQNPPVLAGLSWSGATWAFTTFHAANWHPITWLSHMLDVQLFGLAPAGHHLVNVFLHALDSALVLVALRRMTGRFGASFVVAALFAVHPLHVESVAWVVERKDVLSTFFALSALCAWTRYVSAGSKMAYASALGLFALSLMSKPMLVTFPFALLLFDAWPFVRPERGWWRLTREKVPFIALSIASCVVTLAAQSAGGAIQTTSDLAIGTRILNAVASVGWYASKSLWPSDLSFYYPLANGVSTRAIVVGALVLIGGSIVAIASLRTRPWLSVGWAFFLGTLLPVLGLVQVGGQAHADRYAYVPILGLCLALVWLADELVASSTAKRILAVAFIAMFGILARQRVGAWHDSETLARRAIAVQSDNAVAHDMLGWTLVEQGHMPEGLDHLRTAVALQPADPDGRRNLGRALVRNGNLDAAERELRALVALRPDDPRALAELGSLLATLGQADEARAVLLRAIDRSPDDADVRVTLGELLDRQGDWPGAEREYKAALALDPSNLRANVDLAGVLIAQSRHDEAEKALAVALTVDPRSPQALQQRARIHLARRDPASAARDLRLALDARPDWPLAMDDLAWILATSTDPNLRAPVEALTLATRALELGNQDRAAFLDVLALTLAANNRFDEATLSAQSAEANARAAGDQALAGRIARRLAAYRAHSIDITTPR